MATTRKTDAPATPKAMLAIHPSTRAKLTRTIAYHQAMADEHKDSNAALSATHAEVCKQLQDLLDSSPVISAVDVALARQTIRRTLH